MINSLKIRSSAGCWTCRLRRKKCDEKKGICGVCEALEITCYQGEKPAWMDGGMQEKHMVDELKRMVKEKAFKRREKKWMQGFALESPDAGANVEAGAGAGATDPQQDSIMLNGDEHSGEDSNSDKQSRYATTFSKVSTSTDMTSTTSVSPPDLSELFIAASPFPEDRAEVEVTYTMVYLDYVVPFLFPFYRPHISESSRGWMLVLLMRNRTLFHTALSLATWFYAVALDNLDGTHGECKNANWRELQIQQEIAINAMRQDIQLLNERGVAGAFRESVACLQSIVLLLEYDVAMGKMAQWQAHHDAAVALFDQLLTTHASDPLKPWTSIMDRLGYGTPPKPKIRSMGRDILTAEQAAFRFYTAYLLWIDIMAATARAEVPRLRKYHAELLEGENPIVKLGEYVGCHNWAMLAISDIACLAVHKREQTTAGRLSIRDLARDASAIEERIRANMAADEAQLPMRSGSSNISASPSTSYPFEDISQHDIFNLFDPSAHSAFMPYSGLTSDRLAPAMGITTVPAVALHTRIWAQASLTYLNVVLSGLSPGLPEIRASVDASIDLFQRLPSPLTLRTLVWPFVVTGCLIEAPHGCGGEKSAGAEAREGSTESEGDTRAAFMADLVARMGAMSTIGTIQEAHAVMQKVWDASSTCTHVEPSMWDLATCLSVLGHPSLMV
ncbi:fungal-specific transcription factor domain-containing protein [Xylariaceae sp. FL0255]|nr:fungal-specific transcription factor domain-containing protein [Xylariaceae sp. FL0255]